jgi:hypothetical protein
LGEVDLVDHVLEAAPSRLEALELGVMDDLVDLSADLRVDLGDHSIDRGAIDLREGAGICGGRLLDHQIDGAADLVVALVARAVLGLGEDVFEGYSLGL